MKSECAQENGSVVSTLADGRRLRDIQWELYGGEFLLPISGGVKLLKFAP